MANWEDDYESILGAMKVQDIEELQTDPDTFLAQYNTSTGALITNMLQDETDVLARADKDCLASTEAKACTIFHWWGMQLLFNEPATRLVELGEAGLAGAIAAAGSTVPGLGPVISLVAGTIAGALVIDAAAIAFVDEGFGFHFNWSWAQVAMLTVPGIGSASMAAMLIPFANAS